MTDYTKPIEVICPHGDHFLTQPKKIAEQSEGWDAVMKLAEKYGLIGVAAGGTAILLHPHVQIEQNEYAHIQELNGHAHWMTELPKKVK